MKPAFAVRTTRRFDRLARRLHREHAARFTDAFEAALAILADDPHNRSGRHAIRKLTGVAERAGQYRLRLGRWRFRFDVDDGAVVLHYAGLRREDTYR